jgi:putative ATP-dependent endonuclease of OLD family
MKINSLTLCNFRCFGPEPEKIDLDSGITTFVGSNGSGKTAAVLGLARLFGITRANRTVVPEDFNVSPDSDEASKKLWIEVTLVFPELTENGQSDAIPSVFHHMMVDAPGCPPYCRIRLEAEWYDDHTIDGAIEQKIFWILSPDDPREDNIVPLGHDRGLIQLHYLPATRGATSELQSATRQMLSRLFIAADWSAEVKETIEATSSKVQEDFLGEDAVTLLNTALRKHWSALYEGGTGSEPSLQAMTQRFEEMVRKMEVIFESEAYGYSLGLDGLSDGQKALFYFAVSTAVFDVEGQVRSASFNGEAMAGFIPEKLGSPALTIFGVEEPENHLAPFYLSRIVRLLKNFTNIEGCQAVFTSHSTAILGRVEPRAVRHFRLDSELRTSRVRSLRFPEDDEHASKYLREAVLAYPELYFARFVILAEGDSEQVVLPRLASSMGLEIDPSFIAIVPLGGRHVNHLWMLLSNLEIPFVTLLDLDLGRIGAGWGRIKYACAQLMENGCKRKSLLTVTGEGGKNRVLTQKEFEDMHTWDISKVETLKSWMTCLEEKGVYFSYPLDLDLSMLEKFPNQYKKALEGAPRSTAEAAAVAVLGEAEESVAIYKSDFSECYQLLPWYRYLFLTHSKPATHLRALARLDDKVLESKAPDILKRLLRHVDTEVKRNARCQRGE